MQWLIDFHSLEHKEVVTLCYYDIPIVYYFQQNEKFVVGCEIMEDETDETTIWYFHIIVEKPQLELFIQSKISFRDLILANSDNYLIAFSWAFNIKEIHKLEQIDEEYLPLPDSFVRDLDIVI